MNNKLKFPILYNGKFTFIDNEGKLHKKFSFDHVKESSFSNGYCPFINFRNTSPKNSKHKWREGYIHESGQIIPIIGYEHLEPFRFGLSKIRKNNLYGYLNTDLKEFIPCKYVDAGQFSEELAYISNGKKYGYINLQGEIALELKYDIANSFSCGRAFVETNNDRYFINSNGERVFNLEQGIYTSNVFKEGLIKAWNNSLEFGFLDTNGNISIDLIYKDALDFSEGLAAVKVEDKWGFIDKTGSMVISPKYFFVSYFCKEIAIACVKKGDKLYWGCINKNGEEVIPLEFDSCENYSGKYILASINNEYFHFNNNGDELFKNTNKSKNKYLSLLRKLNTI